MNETSDPEGLEPSVRIEYLGGAGTSAEAPRAPQTPRRRGLGVMAVALGLVALALLWAGGRDNSQEPAEPASNAPDSGEPSSTVWSAFTDDEVEQFPMGDFISSAVRSDDGWVALRRGQRGSRLVTSTDGVEWTPIVGEAPTSNLFGLTRTNAGTWRTLVNSASLNEQRFTLTGLRSTDGVSWQSDVDFEPFSASGNVPSQVALRGENTVVVGDRPLDITTPPAELTAVLATYVSPDVARRTCELIFERAGADQHFELRSCDGELLGTISDDELLRMNTLSTISFLMQFQQVVLVHIDGSPVERVILGPGEQIVSIAPTDDGFLAVVIDSLAGIDTDNVSMGNPPGRLVRWTLAGGIADVTQGLDSPVDLTAWWDNDLVVDDHGVASLATSVVVHRARPPYTEWVEVARGPIAEDPTSSMLRLGPDGSSMVFRDPTAHVWLGRVGGDWVRAPQLDGGVPRYVLLSDDDHIVIAFERDSFVFQLVRVLLPASSDTDLDSEFREEVDPHRITSIAPAGDAWVGATRDGGAVVWSTDGGVSWAMTDGVGEPDRALAVGQGSDGVTRALVTRELEGGTAVETQILSTDGWIHDGERAVFGVQGRIAGSWLGEQSVILVEDSWDRPVSVVSDALVDFVSREVADQTCSVTRTIVDGASVYELATCDGSLLATIGAEAIDIGSESDDRLAFAQEVLRTRNVVHLARPGGPVEVVEMGPSQLVLSLVPTNDGFVAFILDSSEVLGDTNLLYSQALAAQLVRWDRNADEFRIIETPVRGSAWSGNRIVGNADGSLTLVSSLGLYRADPPFEEWTLVTTGPGERLAPGQVFASALFGPGFFVTERGNLRSIWASCCDDEFDTWEEISTVGFAFRRGLISTPSNIVFDTGDGTIVKVGR